jgi:hypothetical protein
MNPFYIEKVCQSTIEVGDETYDAESDGKTESDDEFEEEE